MYLEVNCVSEENNNSENWTLFGVSIIIYKRKIYNEQPQVDLGKSHSVSLGIISLPRP